MKISELVERTQVPKETIHYYIREGVLRKPRKRCKNAAEYNDAYVDQILLIKKLQDNYYLPLSVIKRIFRKLKTCSRQVQCSFELLSKYFLPLDRLLANEVNGKESFLKATGLGEKWLPRLENWGIITGEHNEKGDVYCHDDVVIAKLVVEMDRLGFGPRTGYDPESLKPVADFMYDYVTRGQKEYFQKTMERLPPDELAEKGAKIVEAMSLFFYHQHRKIIRKEYLRMLKAAEAQPQSQQIPKQ